jgi:hypothetical protein
VSDTPTKRTSVSGGGVTVLRRRPALMLMRLVLRNAEATLELGLTKLRKQREQAETWLKQLGAERVEFGDPHFADQADGDPMAARTQRALRSALARHGQSAGAGESAKPTALQLTATGYWPIAHLSAEELLVRVDRLRFETAESGGPKEESDEPPAWASPEEQMRAVMVSMMAPFADSDKPAMLFVSRVDEEALAAAVTEAVARCRRSAEVIARTFGRPLGPPSFVSVTNNRTALHRPELMMTRQRCEGLLADTGYTLGEYEIVSDTPGAVEFHIGVNAHYDLADG